MRTKTIREFADVAIGEIFGYYGETLVKLSDKAQNNAVVIGDDVDEYPGLDVCDRFENLITTLEPHDEIDAQGADDADEDGRVFNDEVKQRVLVSCQRHFEELGAEFEFLRKLLDDNRAVLEQGRGQGAQPRTTQ